MPPFVPFSHTDFDAITEGQHLGPVCLTADQQELLKSQSKFITDGIETEWPSLLCYNVETGDKLLVILDPFRLLIDLHFAVDGTCHFWADYIEPVDIALAGLALEEFCPCLPAFDLLTNA